MSNITTIQWADTTVNTIMGCGGCELYPEPSEIHDAIDRAVLNTGHKISSRKIYRLLLEDVFQHELNCHPAHKKVVNTTNIWHLRLRFVEFVRQNCGDDAAAAAEQTIRSAITCYAAKLHLNKGANILDREGIRPGKDKPRELNKGYAPIFEAVTSFPGRAAKTAKLKDLKGCHHPDTPWKADLARMIFISDMGDAFSSTSYFPYLRRDLMPAVISDDGRRHLWLWLTKRPATMAKFAHEIGGFPKNVCAMTTLTGPDERCLQRLRDLKSVKAKMRGLSIEPLWERIPPSKLNLSGIDWLILGGESGSGSLTRPFALEWAEELRDHCRKHGVAFFLKQLGRNPSRGGEVFRLRDPHGGDWNEWPDEALKVREFPKAFHQFRRGEINPKAGLRPVG